MTAVRTFIFDTENNIFSAAFSVLKMSFLVQCYKWTVDHNLFSDDTVFIF